MMMWIALLAAQAQNWDEYKKKNHLNSVHIGGCVGSSSECMAYSGKIGFTYEDIGFDVGLGPFSASMTFRLYSRIQHRVRPFLYVGHSVIAAIVIAHHPGFGVGADIHMGRFMLRPTIESNEWGDIRPALGLYFKI